MKQENHALSFIVLWFIFCSCSPKINLSPVHPVILDKASISLDQKVLSGTGRVLFNQPLFGLFSKEFYFINANLFDEESVFILHSHFTGFAKEDGIKVFFRRDKHTLTIELATPSYPLQILNTQENYFLKNQNIKVYLEITNGSKNFVEVKIWNSYINPTQYLKKSANFFSIENLIADSNDFIFYSKGQGLLWGVELNKAQLKEIQRRSIEQ